MPAVCLVRKCCPKRARFVFLHVGYTISFSTVYHWLVCVCAFETSFYNASKFISRFWDWFARFQYIANMHLLKSDDWNHAWLEKMIELLSILIVMHRHQECLERPCPCKQNIPSSQLFGWRTNLQRWCCLCLIFVQVCNVAKWSFFEVLPFCRMLPLR